MYQKPTVSRLGSLAELTMDHKNWGGDDGWSFMGITIPIGRLS